MMTRNMSRTQSDTILLSNFLHYQAVSSTKRKKGVLTFGDTT